MISRAGQEVERQTIVRYRQHRKIEINEKTKQIYDRSKEVEKRGWQLRSINKSTRLY